MGFFDKIDNASGSNIIKKVRHWRSGKMFVTVLVNAWHSIRMCLTVSGQWQGPQNPTQRLQDGDGWATGRHQFLFTLLLVCEKWMRTSTRRSLGGCARLSLTWGSDRHSISEWRLSEPVTSDHVRLLGVTISFDLSPEKHVLVMINMLMLAPSDSSYSTIPWHTPSTQRHLYMHSLRLVLTIVTPCWRGRLGLLLTGFGVCWMVQLESSPECGSLTAYCLTCFTRSYTLTEHSSACPV